ncbi:hypothetical protein PPTG_11794 [Phytophthora nicotianae INRA-310]|uniref:Carbohydrate-binding module family 19 domain-containing protein n=1 Tax=Phytophthora nicotianae (strain INRA-310) TaxID=761204 RepID=W2QA18_PHYN3|nr:hypothetical protein PPTG_11794 [Phytophthora nicotianae INRA-310]ETN09379.1 hypothetical protein PPTG_11794 [Phytophthora nicotianae INRA-310]
MWPKLAVAGALLLIQGAVADDCAYTVSVLDIAGVQCVSSAPCSGTYYASGLSQGVGACPTGTSCALLPETPIMGCAASGRTDLIYVNSDGTLTKDGKSVTLSGASSNTADSTTTAPTTSNTNSATSSSSKSTSSSSTANSGNGSNDSSSTADSSNGSNDSNANSGSGSTTASGSNGSDATADSSNSTATSASSAANSSSSTSRSWRSDSGSGSVTISPGSSSANQQSFNPGSILSDGSNKTKSGDGGGLGIGSIIAIVVGCLAVVAIAAGARLLRKGKEAELATPEAPGAMEGYNNGGGGGGMTPKENVLLL